jgi:outer membrane protein
MRRFIYLFIIQLVTCPGVLLYSQSGNDSLLFIANLDNCVQYAEKHQPVMQQSLIDEQITNREIKSQLSDWYPQLNFYGNYTNNFQLQKSLFGSQLVNIGTYNSSTGQVALTQTIFNRDVLLAKKTAGDVRKLSKQITVNKGIELAANVSKAFYDVLLSKEQIELVRQDILLLERSYKDAYNQYKGGIVDKTDYQRASISLNNAKAQKKTDEEQLKSKYAVLKLLMSYPTESQLDLVYDSTQMAAEAAQVDTIEQVNYANRIEFQSLLTQKRLLEANVSYYKWVYLPSLSAFGQYNFNYFNNELSQLYGNNYPNSYAGIGLTLPIFQGTKRVQQIRIAQLQLSRLDYDFVALKDSINAQYQEVLSVYKSNVINYYLQKDNLQLAKEVYNIIQTQYRSGIKTYLDVITANNDLFSAQINYTNALYQVLSNKVDLKRSLGTLSY